MKPLEEADLFKTIDETVALMINLDYIPPGVSLLEMTEAYLYVAEEDYESAKYEVSSYNKLEVLRLRVESCRCRHELAQSLIAQLTYEAENHCDLELENPDDVLLDIDNQSPPKICYVNAIDWAYDKLGISIPDLLIGRRIKKTAWEEVTIKINPKYRIGYKIKEGEFKYTTFEKIGLKGDDLFKENGEAKMLLTLAISSIYVGYQGTLPSNIRVKFTRLRKSLRKLASLKGDPFYPVNKGIGLKPRFKLIDASDGFYG